MIITKTLPSFVIGSAILLASPIFAKSSAKVMFDDFSYKTLKDAQRNGWVPRTQVGHPGIKNATWWSEGISFHPDQTKR